MGGILVSLPPVAIKALQASHIFLVASEPCWLLPINATAYPASMTCESENEKGEINMGNLSLFHWLVILLVYVPGIWGSIRIVKRL